MVVENCCLLAQLLDGAVFILSVLQDVLRFACYEQSLLFHLVASYRYLGLKLCVQSAYSSCTNEILTKGHLQFTYTCLMYNVPGGRQKKKVNNNNIRSHGTYIGSYQIAMITSWQL